MLRELAILRHFYNINRSDALQLPKWEWENLICQFAAFKAEDRIHATYASSFGFSGGESAKAYLKNLELIIDATTNKESTNENKTWKDVKGKEFGKLESYGTEEDIQALDKFLTAVLA